MCDSIKNCKYCNQPVEPDFITNWKGEVNTLYTCRNRQCRAGKHDITLDAKGFENLDEATLQSYERGQQHKMAVAS